MRLSTSSNMLFIRPDQSRATLPHTIEMLAGAGFRVLDINFYDWTLPGSPFLTDGWERWCAEIGEAAGRWSMEFGQFHGYFYGRYQPQWSAEERQYREMLVHRAIQVGGALGAKVCVVHPETDYTSPLRVMEQSWQKNKEYLLQLCAFADAYNIRLAVENMCDYAIAPKRKFCATPEQLVAFVDDINDPRVGICWDFEHGTNMEQNQAEALHHIGHRLIATHVSDGNDKKAEHLLHMLPYAGLAQWEDKMQALADIGYQGDLSFEVHNYANRIPDALLPDALRYAVRVGEHLLGLAKPGTEKGGQ